MASCVLIHINLSFPRLTQVKLLMPELSRSPLALQLFYYACLLSYGSPSIPMMTHVLSLVVFGGCAGDCTAQFATHTGVHSQCILSLGLEVEGVEELSHDVVVFYHSAVR